MIYRKNQSEVRESDSSVANFSRTQKNIYLDYAAATPVDEKVLAVMLPYFRENFYNPSAAYLSAKSVREDLENARHSVAQILGSRPAEIVFTAGATESINLAFNFPRTTKRAKILISAVEHESVLSAAARDTIFTKVQLIKVDKFGRVDLDDLRAKINDDTAMISIGYANNEIGTVQPIREIAEIVKKVREDRTDRGIKNHILFHIDASQAAGYLDLNVARLGIDLMTLNAAKCYGPKQVGLLYVRAGVKLNPLFAGGGQEMNLRSGTENVAGAIGFAKALGLAEKHRAAETKRLKLLRDDLEGFITKEFPNVQINGSQKARLPNLLNFSLPNLDGERAVFALDQRGIQVATGSACAANKGTRSHVLAAIGLPPKIADGSLRISLGRPTTREEIERAKPILLDVLREQLKFGSQK